MAAMADLTYLTVSVPMCEYVCESGVEAGRYHRTYLTYLPRYGPFLVFAEATL